MHQNFMIVFLVILLALILEQWAQRTSDLFFYQQLGLDPTSLSQNLLVTLGLLIIFFIIIWYLIRMHYGALPSVSTAVKKSI